MKKRKRAQRRVLVIVVILLLAIVASLYAMSTARKASYPVRYQEIAEQKAEQYDLPLSLVMAVIRTESSFQADAVSNVGAVGLMQIMPDTGRWIAGKLGWEDYTDAMLTDPEKNIELGCWYLRFLMDRFEGDMTAVLAGYNAGHNRVAQWLQDPANTQDGKLVYVPHPDAEEYVERVLYAQTKYQEIYQMD